MAPLGETIARRGFGRPTGLLGRLGGRLMARGNAATERHAVALADPPPGSTALALGPGPGVGVAALLAAGAGRVIAVDPSPVMLAACRRRSPDADVELIEGVAERTGLPDAAVDVAVSVNNVMIWDDRAAGFVELHRVLRPGARLVVAAHARWLDGGGAGLAELATAAGFTDVAHTCWEPPGRGAGTSVVLTALRAIAAEGTLDRCPRRW